MPLSKAKDRERKEKARLEYTQKLGYDPQKFRDAHRKVYPQFEDKDYNPELDPYVNPVLYAYSNLNVRPKLPWYAGAGDHFGEVRNKQYAEQFLSSLR